MFQVVSPYSPAGDQPKAIQTLSDGLKKGYKEQTLLGVTGSGKTYIMAKVIENANKPTLVLAHNKTLAAQLCGELRELFPNNAVEYFVSYYDYYQPEAYVPHTDTYIEKDMSINDEIDRLRNSATSSLFERDDVIIVSSVSCIYSLGDPETYRKMTVSVRLGQIYDRDKMIDDLVKIRYNRNDYDLVRGTFRVRGDVLEIFPSSEFERLIRIEFFDNEIDRICLVNHVTGEVQETLKHISVYPAMQYITDEERMEKAIAEIHEELEQRVDEFTAQKKLIEAQRIKERTLYDIEFLRQLGYCKGVENYSRVLSGRAPGSTPYTLLDFFPDDFLVIIDESHVTVPQVRGMSAGDRARKKNLVDFGFRLPSAYDNRPLTFEEFNKRIKQVIYVSATPSQYERERSAQIAECIIRPTGLVDPEISVRPSENQIDDLVGEINERISKKERTLVITLTKRMAESLSEYLKGLDIKVRYMHHDIDTLDRVEILRDLRKGEFDVLVGINLLREGLDLPEVSLIAILDADKEGFLRNETSLIQIIGRAARNVSGKVIMYADSVTEAMEKAIVETERRRKIQIEYNTEHGIVPKTIVKNIYGAIAVSDVVDEVKKLDNENEEHIKNMSKTEKDRLIKKITAEMLDAAKKLEFEYAAKLRDELKKLRE